MDENDLRPYLEEFGTISEISIIRERDRDTGAFSSKGITLLLLEILNFSSFHLFRLCVCNIRICRIR